MCQNDLPQPHRKDMALGRVASAMVQAFRGLDGMDQPAFPTGGRSGAAEIFERKSRTPRGGQGLEPCEAEEA